MPAALSQLVDLAFPFSLYEHAPFVARGIPAITLTTVGRPAAPQPRPTPSTACAENNSDASVGRRSP